MPAASEADAKRVDDAVRAKDEQALRDAVSKDDTRELGSLTAFLPEKHQRKLSTNKKTGKSGIKDIWRRSSQSFHEKEAADKLALAAAAAEAAQEAADAAAGLM